MPIEDLQITIGSALGLRGQRQENKSPLREKSGYLHRVPLPVADPELPRGSKIRWLSRRRVDFCNYLRNWARLESICKKAYIHGDRPAFRQDSQTKLARPPSARSRRSCSKAIRREPCRLSRRLAKTGIGQCATVLRFLAKIGYLRFADFQAAAIADVERQLGFAAEQHPHDVATETPNHVYQRTLLLQAEALQLAASQAMPAEFDAIVDLLINPKAVIKLLGGR